MAEPEAVKRALPDSFRPATWRGTVGADDEGRVGLAIDCGGETYRYALDERDALNVVATLAEALSARQNSRSHSDTSSGMPSREVSTPDDGENV